jgi:hypothetical protein
MDDDLKKAFELNKHDLCILQNMGQSTAQLLDENDPNGIVVIRDERGNDRLFMPRCVWDELRQEK